MNCAIFVKIVYFMFWACGLLTTSKGQATNDSSNPIHDEQLRKIVDKTYLWTINTLSPLGLMERASPQQLIPQYTEEGFTKQYNEANGLLSDLLKTVNEYELESRQDQITFEVTRQSLERFIAGYKFRKQSVYNPLNFYFGIPHIFIKAFRGFQITTMINLDNYAQLLGNNGTCVSTYISQVQELLTISIKEGYTLYKTSIISVPSAISRLLSKPAKESVFYVPIKDNNSSISQSPKYQKIKQEAPRLIKDNIYSKLQIFKKFLEQKYIPSTRKFPGVINLPDGEAFYQECIRWHLSGEYSPSYLHWLGTREVSRIEQEMKKIMNRHGAAGFTIPEFLKKINKNKAFFYKTGDEILDGYREMIDKRIKPKLKTDFDVMPKAPLVVRPARRNGPQGVYVLDRADKQGIFLANVMKPNKQAKYNMMALALHEALPGHHMQVALAFENHNLPSIRRDPVLLPFTRVPFSIPKYTAYTEGWGLYAEYLGLELKLYKDDFELFGRYGFELWRACRLVVDTGIHHLNWTRQQAIDYLTKYAIAPELIGFEVDRYISTPGQALAYKIGEITIRELREKVAKKLGKKFDHERLKQFHRVILETGPVPLTVLERVLDWWIADTKMEVGGLKLNSSAISLQFLPINVLFLILFYCLFNT